ncbi:MAG: hypothetical protein IPJ90_19000 [Anaerolineaceae bacterium]|nr:hypothetical protein [Anaerolineaceae bacterium]
MNREKLHTLIDQSFNIDDLKTLCFNLHIDYDSILGEGKKAKIRELILEFERINKTNELVTKCQEMRPNISWHSSREFTQPIQVKTEARESQNIQNILTSKGINDSQKRLWIIILAASPIIGLVGVFYAFTPVIFLILMISLQVIIGFKSKALSEIYVFAPASAIIAVGSMSLFGVTTSLDVGEIQLAEVIASIILFTISGIILGAIILRLRRWFGNPPDQI